MRIVQKPEVQKRGRTEIKTRMSGNIKGQKIMKDKIEDCFREGL